MSILNCYESQQACSNYIENLNGSSMKNFAFYPTYLTTCNKGYNYYDKSQFGNVTAQKGFKLIIIATNYDSLRHPYFSEWN